MKLLIDAFIVFIGVGLYEGLYKPNAVRFTNSTLRKFAPAVMRRLDPQLPEVLTECSGVTLDALVRKLYEEESGQDWTRADLTEFYRIFDIRKAADNITAERASIQ